MIALGKKTLLKQYNKKANSGLTCKCEQMQLLISLYENKRTLQTKPDQLNQNSKILNAFYVIYYFCNQ